MKSIVCTFLAGLCAIVLLTGCGGDDSTPETDTEVVQISGAGIKGPLAFADVKIYKLDPSYPDFYDKASPISVAITNQYAEINGLSVPRKIKPPYILTIDGSNGVDLNTGKPPIIDTLITVITDDMLSSNRPIFATPLTTLAFHMARFKTESSSYKNHQAAGKAFYQNLSSTSVIVSEIFAVGQNANIDIFRAPLVINEFTVDLVDQELAVYHRAAVEAFAAKVYATPMLEYDTPDIVIQKIAKDLYKDAVIDNADNGTKIGNINPDILVQDPMELRIPNTSYLVKDIMKLMDEERVLIGMDMAAPFLIESIAFPEDSAATVSSTSTVETESTNTAVVMQLPEVTLSMESIDLGGVPVGSTSDPVTLILTNSGTAPLNISGISISSGFIEANNCDAGVAVSESCAIDVQFVSQAAGDLTGTLTITSDSITAPDTVILTGNGSVDGQEVTEPSGSTPVVDPDAPSIQFYHDFYEDNIGIYTLDDLRSYWNTNNASVSLKDYGTTEIVSDPNNSRHGKVMSVFFAEGGVGYQSFVCCSGTQWRTSLPAKEELYLSYDVMFEEGFEFVLGGKLPGLYWGEFIGGGNIPDGYDGGSGRLMWHPDGEILNYTYHAGMTSAYGQVDRWGFGERKYFVPGKWQNLEVRYVMNTPGVANGIIQAWLDGELVMDRRDFQFRNTGSMTLSGLIVTTYFGGHTEKWASPKDQHVFFDNFIVSTQPINH